MTLSQEDVLRQLAEAVKADGLPWTPSGKAEEDRAPVAKERPELDLGTIPEGMADEAERLKDEYRRGLIGATAARQLFNAKVQERKVEDAHLIHDAHEAESKQEMWGYIEKAMEAADEAMSELDPYLTDEERQKRAELDKAVENAETEEERAAAARRRLEYDLILADRAKDRGADPAVVDAAKNDIRKGLDTLNRLQEKLVMENPAYSAEQKEALIASMREKNNKLADAGDMGPIRDSIQTAQKQLESMRYDIPSHIADQLAPMMEAAPAGFRVEEASVAESQNPASTTGVQRGNATVFEL